MDYNREYMINKLKLTYLNKLNENTPLKDNTNYEMFNKRSQLRLDSSNKMFNGLLLDKPYEYDVEEMNRKDLFAASCQNHLLNKYPARSEYESIGRHTLNANERNEQLKQLLNDDLDRIPARDPCIEVETIVRVPKTPTKQRRDSHSQNGIKSILKKPVMMDNIRIPISVQPRRKVDLDKMKKLSKSSMELTTVANNETIVTSNPFGGVPNERFLVFYPSGKSATNKQVEYYAKEVS